MVENVKSSDGRITVDTIGGLEDKGAFQYDECKGCSVQNVFSQSRVWSSCMREWLTVECSHWSRICKVGVNTTPVIVWICRAKQACISRAKQTCLVSSYLLHNRIDIHLWLTESRLSTKRFQSKHTRRHRRGDEKITNLINHPAVFRA